MHAFLSLLVNLGKVCRERGHLCFVGCANCIRVGGILNESDNISNKFWDCTKKSGSKEQAQLGILSTAITGGFQAEEGLAEG